MNTGERHRGVTGAGSRLGQGRQKAGWPGDPGSSPVRNQQGAKAKAPAQMPCSSLSPRPLQCRGGCRRGPWEEGEQEAGHGPGGKTEKTLEPQRPLTCSHGLLSKCLY